MENTNEQPKTNEGTTSFSGLSVVEWLLSKDQDPNRAQEAIREYLAMQLITDIAEVFAEPTQQAKSISK